MEKMYAETNRPTPEKLEEMKAALKKELNKRIRA